MKISVIMPVYNSEEYLEAAINSVLAQNVELEIIAVDDCSSDRSRDILTALAEKDDRVKYYFNEKNIGVAAVRNKALDLATGEYLAFCDSDDIVPSGAYGALLSVIGDADIAVGAHRDMYDDGSMGILCSVSRGDRGSVFKSLFSVSCLWTKLIRRSFIAENSLRFDVTMRIGEDVVFLAESVTKKPSVAVTDALVYYHMLHRNTSKPSLIHIYTLDAFRLHLECRERALEICRDVEEAEDFIYTNFTAYINEFILKMPVGDELATAFELFRSHILAYSEFKENKALFTALFGMSREELTNIGAEAYRERVMSFAARERVLAEYEAGRIGFTWIFKYFKAWLRFKMKGRKNKK